jgi:hypothetical protein
MVTATSIVPAALTALQAQLSAEMAAASGFETVQIFTGDMSSEPPTEAVILSGSNDWNQEWAAIGNLRKDEAFTVGCGIWVLIPGADQAVMQAAYDRAYAILAIIETYLRKSLVHGDAVDGITLQGTVKRAEWQPEGFTDGSNSAGRYFGIIGGIAISGRLRKG